jgi:hypothetical protein
MGEGGYEERADFDASELLVVTLEMSDDSAGLYSGGSPASNDPGSAWPAALSLRALSFLH